MFASPALRGSSASTVTSTAPAPTAAEATDKDDADYKPFPIFASSRYVTKTAMQTTAPAPAPAPAPILVKAEAEEDDDLVPTMLAPQQATAADAKKGGEEEDTCDCDGILEDSGFD
jgi:hypothetical protein